MALTHEERNELRAQVSQARRERAANAARLGARKTSAAEIDPLEELRPELWKRVSPSLIQTIIGLEEAARRG